jgi:hypothetical protein
VKNRFLVVVSRATLYVLTTLGLTMTFTGIHQSVLKMLKKRSIIPVTIPLQVFNHNAQNQDDDDDDEAPRINNNQHNDEILASKGYYIIWIVFAVICTFVILSQMADQNKTYLILRRLAEDWIPLIIVSILLPLLLFRKKPTVKKFMYDWYNIQ